MFSVEEQKELERGGARGGHKGLGEVAEITVLGMCSSSPEHLRMDGKPPEASESCPSKSSLEQGSP